MLPMALRTVSKEEFYKLVGNPETVLVIATGEKSRFANLILRTGVIV